MNYDISWLRRGSISISKLPNPKKRKDWNIRQLLHTIFSDFRKGDRISTVIICNDKEELFIAESYFWEESLALIGKHDTVKAFKREIDAVSVNFWLAIFSKEKELENNTETPFLNEPWNGYIEELLALRNIGDYFKWVSTLNVSVSVFTYCHKKLSKRGGLLSFVSLLWMVANGQVLDSCISPMAY